MFSTGIQQVAHEHGVLVVCMRLMADDTATEPGLRVVCASTCCCLALGVFVPYPDTS
jgi:hypothetical protein